MLRIIVSASVGQAKKYYSEGLTREGYYSEGQEMAGQWGGLAAEKLGLQGPVTKEAFAALCDNLNPATGKRLTGRTLDNRRVGYDFNFHVPKSVTLAYHWHKDERILTAFRESVQETMRELEQDAAARVRVNLISAIEGVVKSGLWQ
jgi:conjugative relaxase-like TrwC/TraI family protein